MSNRIYEREGDRMYVDSDGGGRGIGDGLGGIGAIIALVVVVAILWFLAREGRGCNDGCNNGGGYPYPPAYPYPPVYPYGGGNCNSPLDCKIPMTPDMSNCEVDRDLWKVDADLLKCCCEEKEVTHMEAEATRALINANTMQDLRDKLSMEYAKNSSYETKEYTAGLFGKLENMIYKMDGQNDKQIAGLAGMIKDLKCDFDFNIPKRPPIWCEGITPNTHHTDCHDRFPQRKGCGCNDGCFDNCSGF